VATSIIAGTRDELVFDWVVEAVRNLYQDSGVSKVKYTEMDIGHNF